MFSFEFDSNYKPRSLTLDGGLENNNLWSELENVECRVNNQSVLLTV